MDWSYIIEKMGGVLPQMFWIVESLFETTDTFTSWLIGGGDFIYSTLTDAIDSMMDVKTYVPNANAIINGVADLASVILVIIFLKNIFTNYILDIDGEIEEDPIQSLIRVALALAVANCSGEIHQILMKVENYIQLYLSAILAESMVWEELSLIDVFENVVAAVVATPQIIAIVANPVLMTAVSLIILIWVIAFIILVIVLVCKILFRSVELFLFQCLLPIFACDLVTNRKELWKPFFRAYLTTIFGFTIQFFCLGLSLIVLASIAVEPEIILAVKILPLLFSTFLLFFACKAPKWLSTFTYQTGGGGGAVGSGLKGIASGATQVINVVGMIK